MDEPVVDQTPFTIDILAQVLELLLTRPQANGRAEREEVVRLKVPHYKWY